MTATPATLTAREREICEWLARNYTPQEIARVICKQDQTVYDHIRSIRLKTGCGKGLARLAEAARCCMSDLVAPET